MDAVTVGLDIGTTSIKAVAVDGSGQVLQRARLPHKVIVAEPHMMEHDAATAWRRGPRRALAALGVHPAAVAVTSMVPSLTAVDRKGRPLTPGLLYGDGRAFTDAAGGPVSDRPAGGSGTGDSGTGDSGTGHSGTGGSQTGAADAGDQQTGGAEVEGFLRWTAAAAPQAHGYWPAQAVANFALGGRPAVDYSVAFTAMPVYGTEGWDADVCRRCGARPEQLAEVELPAAAVGRLDGAVDGPVLTSGSVDVWCEQLVAGASEAGDVHVICGTTLIVWAIAPATGGKEPHPGLWTVPHSAAGLRMIGGASNAGGLFLDWVGRLVGRAGRGVAGGVPGGGVPGGGVPAGGVAAGGVDPANIPVWVPYPRGERTPYHDPRRRAALSDLDLTHGPAAITQAAWEASAFVVRHHLDLAGVRARRIVATGGGTKVPGWMQALADGTGLPVHVAAEPEGAARGAAFLARVAAGLETDFTDAARWASTATVLDPRPAWAGPADGRYRRFLELSGPPDPTVP